VSKKIVVVAPHPDDEVLGVGGTIAKLAAAGADVFVAIVTKGYPPAFDEALIAKGRQEALEAHKLLGVRRTIFLDLPAAALDTLQHAALNRALLHLVSELHPEAVFLPFVGDIHLDHQLVFQSGMVACRPGSHSTVSAVYAYETLSETNWNAPYVTPGFVPNVFVDISEFLEMKIAAMQAYASQIKPFPHERSAEALRALATLRGATVGVSASEAFVLVRSVITQSDIVQSLH
jgi:LmbE family N-acetylglucosaminyl deacetylase